MLDAGYLWEEPGAGKPPARICEGDAEWPSYSTTISKTVEINFGPAVSRWQLDRPCRTRSYQVEGEASWNAGHA